MSADFFSQTNPKLRNRLGSNAKFYTICTREAAATDQPARGAVQPIARELVDRLRRCRCRERHLSAAGLQHPLCVRSGQLYGESGYAIADPTYDAAARGAERPPLLQRRSVGARSALLQPVPTPLRPSTHQQAHPLRPLCRRSPAIHRDRVSGPGRSHRRRAGAAWARPRPASRQDPHRPQPPRRRVPRPTPAGCRQRQAPTRKGPQGKSASPQLRPHHPASGRCPSIAREATPAPPRTKLPQASATRRQKAAPALIASYPTLSQYHPCTAEPAGYTVALVPR